jgi:hypothetical protein
MVRFTPSSFAVSAGHEAGALEPASAEPAPGSLHAAVSSATAAAVIKVLRNLLIGRRPCPDDVLVEHSDAGGSGGTAVMSLAR